MVRHFATRHVLTFGFLAVVVPLAVLLALQYSWLADRQEKSARAEEVYLWNYLEGISGKVETFYRQQAERALNVPPELFLERDREQVARYFLKKAPEGVKLLFAVNFVHDGWGGIVVCDPLTDLWGEPADVAMARAIGIALSPWKTLSERGSPLRTQPIVVEEKDPANRILLSPVTDDEAQVLGVAGLIVDSYHFTTELLPSVVLGSLPTERAGLVVRVLDGEGQTVLREGEEGKIGLEVRGQIPFVFSDWQIVLGRVGTPGAWARWDFLFDVALSGALAAVLVGGLAFALRAAARELRLSRMKSDFVSNVSHELRTPLASIRVFGELLRLGRAGEGEKIREYGEYIETESRRLTRLIDNILDFAKIESGSRTYAFELSDLEALVEEALRPLAVSLAQSGFALRYEPPPAPLPPIRVDREALAQALANLVDNAVKYSGESREVAVRVERVDGEVRVAVADRGVGIAPDEHQRIFERFHRVSTGLVHDVRGSGLGLAIVRHVAEAHGGRVSVLSEPGRGSTFTLHLPAGEGACAAC